MHIYISPLLDGKSGCAAGRSEWHHTGHHELEGTCIVTLLHLPSLNHERRTVLEVGLLCEAPLRRCMSSAIPLVAL
jgi:hypothetical protein